MQWEKTTQMKTQALRGGLAGEVAWDKEDHLVNILHADNVWSSDVIACFL